ncbi:hypothetical protein D3C85_1028690 [compost metagenome]
MNPPVRKPLLLKSVKNAAVVVDAAKSVVPRLLAPLVIPKPDNVFGLDVISLQDGTYPIDL